MADTTSSSESVKVTNRLHYGGLFHLSYVQSWSVTQKDGITSMHTACVRIQISAVRFRTLSQRHGVADLSTGKPEPIRAVQIGAGDTLGVVY
jgi:hypothetical protein